MRSWIRRSTPQSRWTLDLEMQVPKMVPFSAGTTLATATAPRNSACVWALGGAATPTTVSTASSMPTALASAWAGCAQHVEALPTVRPSGLFAPPSKSGVVFTPAMSVQALRVNVTGESVLMANVHRSDRSGMRTPAPPHHHMAGTWIPPARRPGDDRGFPGTAGRRVATCGSKRGPEAGEPNRLGGWTSSRLALATPTAGSLESIAPWGSTVLSNLHEPTVGDLGPAQPPMAWVRG